MTAASVDPDTERGPKPACNHHCSVVEIGGFGVLIEGPSGSGKTSLALGLLERCTARGIESALVGDDQVLLTCDEGSLKAVVPEVISGMAEIRGYGIAALPFKNSAVVHLVVRLVGDEQVERMPEQNDLDQVGNLVLDAPIPLYLLPRRHEAQSVRIVMAVLENRFGLKA